MKISLQILNYQLLLLNIIKIKNKRIFRMSKYIKNIIEDKKYKAIITNLS
jgi:hypothetical protein